MSFKKILIVDDEPDILEMSKKRLQHAGFQALTASNGVEAGLIISSQKPDAILLDIKMLGINGAQACAALKANPQTKDIPIILISALPYEDPLVSRALKCGAIDYFNKPFDFDKLIDRIKEILGIK